MASSRYQQRTLYAERGGVLTYEGLDPLTGLPVLIYRFKGQIARALENLESENIPGILEVSSENGESRMVTAYSREYRPLVHPLPIPVSVLLLDSARALKDAAQAGVLHGDLRPVRFLASRDHVLVEGFGIPWPSEPSPYRASEPQASFAGDIYAWAKSMLDLAGEEVSPDVRKLLERCLANDPLERPEAPVLYTRLEALAGRSAPAAASRPAGLEDELRFDDEDAAPEASFAREPPAFDLTLTPTEEDPEENPAPPEALGAWEREDALDADPVLLVSDPGVRPTEPSSPRAETARPRPASPPQRQPSPTEERRFVKELPPGATYRTGGKETGAYLRPGSFEEYTFDDGEESGKRKRRLFLLLFLFVLALALGFLAFFRQRQNLADVLGNPAPASSYFVDVAVEPAGLPPVTVYVVSSPEGSRLQPGEGLREVAPGQPGQLVLDQTGVWRLQGRLEDQASEVITLEVPEERTVTIVMPNP